jgi:hypothetical protein
VLFYVNGFGTMCMRERLCGEWWWTLSFYCALVCGEGCRFPWKSIWQFKVPLMVVFAWLEALGKILTMNNLKKQHITVVDRCSMCKRNGESVDHLILQCDVGYATWIAFFNCFELSCW